MIRKPHRRGDTGTSAELVRRRLLELGLSKTDLARRVGVSPDYIFRILNGRVPFPRVRETLEQMAEALGVKPEDFTEYRTLAQAVPPSTAVVWSRMKELGMDREALYQALGGRLSRPYFNSILRGDQPFPTNRAFVNLFALALDLNPESFPEFQRGTTERRSSSPNVGDVEAKALSLCFEAAMVRQGLMAGEGPALDLLAPVVDGLLPERKRLQASCLAVLERAGELGLAFDELARMGGISGPRLRVLLKQADKAPDAEGAVEWGRLAEALRVPVAAGK